MSVRNRKSGVCNLFGSKNLRKCAKLRVKLRPTRFCEPIGPFIEVGSALQAFLLSKLAVIPRHSDHTCSHENNRFLINFPFFVRGRTRGDQEHEAYDRCGGEPCEGREQINRSLSRRQVTLADPPRAERVEYVIFADRPQPLLDEVEHRICEEGGEGQVNIVRPSPLPWRGFRRFLAGDWPGGRWRGQSRAREPRG